MKTCDRVKEKFLVFLTSELNGGKWSASRSGRFSPEERATSTQWIGCMVGTSGLGGAEEGRNFYPNGNLTSVLLAVESKFNG
jgi:hypothetical protein